MFPGSISFRTEINLTLYQVKRSVMPMPPFFFSMLWLSGLWFQMKSSVVLFTSFVKFSEVSRTDKNELGKS